MIHEDYVNMTFVEKVYDRIWDTKFWLPMGITWSELYEYTHFDIKTLVPSACLVALLIYIVRMIFEKFVATPFGRYLNVLDKEVFVANTVLEEYYKGNKQVLSESVLMLIAKESDIEFEYVKKWFKSRKALNLPSQLKKFSESMWRFTFYLVAWIYGVYILYDKAWSWNTAYCWYDYPRQEIEPDIFYYYFIEISFYFSLLASQFTDVRRKDFWQMFLHHIVTISLLLFSLMCNFQRVGSLVIVLHDTADSWLELAKMGSYAKLNWVCDPAFAIFTLIWMLTRLLAFPLIILYTTTFEALEILERFPAYYYFNALLYTLQLMHIIWFYMILRVAYKSFFKGVREDNRSESGDSEHEHQE